MTKLVFLYHKNWITIFLVTLNHILNNNGETDLSGFQFASKERQIVTASLDSS